MQELRNIRLKIHEEAKILRNIDYILSRPSFENLWVLSSEAQKEDLQKYIVERSKDNIINWYKNHKLLDIGEQTLSQLRETAKTLCVPNYSRMSKPELLLAIKIVTENPEMPDMTPIDMIPEMRKFIDTMRPLMIEATIPEDYLDFPEEAEDFDIKIISDAYLWLEEVYNKEFRGAKSIKSLLSEEMWERYRAWADFGDHREVLLLTEALQCLRKKIMTAQRPILFKRTMMKAYIIKLRKEKK